MRNELSDNTKPLLIDLPSPFSLLNIAGQNVFPIYDSNTGCPLMRPCAFIGTHGTLALLDGRLERPEKYEPFRITVVKPGHHYATIWVDGSDEKRTQEVALAAVAALAQLDGQEITA